MHKFFESCQSDKMSNLETDKTYALFTNALNKKLIFQLKSQGRNVVVFPTVIAEKLELSRKAQEKLKKLTEFDWLILTDVFAVDFFVEALRELEIDLFELDALRVCALGEAVADRLRFDQIHADLIPSKNDAADLISKMSEYSSDKIENLKSLLIGEINAKTHIYQNSEPEFLPIYAAKFDDYSLKTKSLTLLKGGAIDEFIFSSPEDLVSLNFICDELELANVMTEIQISATTDSAYQALTDQGLRPLYFHFN